MKPFLPQLQTTFLKALGDAESMVRVEGGRALVPLLMHSRKVDAVIKDLLANLHRYMRVMTVGVCVGG